MSQMQNSTNEQHEERALREAPLLLPRLQALRKLWVEGVISAADVCVAYIFAYLQVRHGPGRWFTGRRQHPPSLTELEDVTCSHTQPSLQILDERLRPIFDAPTEREWAKLKLKTDATLRDVIEVARCSQIPEHVYPCLTNFYAGRRPLVLLWRVPSAQEVLEMQADGRRCVSALVSEKALKTIFGHRGCLEMLIHDLAHMERLIEAGRFWQQTGFFEFLLATVAPKHQDHWSKALGNRWRLSWRYVSSDMNAVANHMLQTLKWQLAVAIARAVLRDAGFVSVEDEEADKALADEQSDVYPRAALADWEPALKTAGLLQVFEESFTREWHDMFLSHTQDVWERYPGIFNEEHLVQSDVLCELGPKFAQWPRPSRQTFLAAVAADIGKTSEGNDENVRAQRAAAVIAHFDELGRRRLSAIGTGTPASFRDSTPVVTLTFDELEMSIKCFLSLT